MNLENIALKLGISKEVLILVAVETAIIAVATLAGIPAEKVSKLPY